MQYNKQYFFQEIFSVVFALHLVVLMIVFVCDTGKFHQERFVINTDNVQSTIVFMPLKKRVEQKPQALKHQSKQTKDRKVMSYNEYEKKVKKREKKNKVIKKTVSKNIVKPVPIKKPEVVKKQVVPSKPITPTLPTVLKADSKNKVRVDKIVEKKATTSVQSIQKTKEKIAPINKIDKIDKVDKKIIEKIKEPIVEQVKVDPVIVPIVPEVVQQLEIVPVEEVLVAPKDLSVNQIDNQVEEQEHDDDGSISFVGTLDLELIQIKEQIRVQVAKHYKPPVGIAKTAVCQLTIIVGKDGKAQQVTVKKGSGSMANDLCARAALLKITFPKEVIGKEIVVELGQ